MTQTDALWIALVFIGLAGSALCSGLEVGLYSVSRVLMRVRTATNPRSARLERELSSPVQALTTLLAYNNIFNYIGTLAITALLTKTGLSDTLIIVLQACVLTPVILIAAESVPKELFRSRANTITERFATTLTVMRLSMTVIPVVPLIRVVAAALSKLSGGDFSGSVRSARETMSDLIKHGDESMSISQAALIDRALVLERLHIDDLMVPIASVATFSIDDPLDRALASAKRRVHSRYPVRDKSGRCVGYVRALDMHAPDTVSIKDILRPIARVRSGDPVPGAMRTLQEHTAPIAVVERAGKDAGIVTRKDLLGPLIGDFSDW